MKKTAQVAAAAAIAILAMMALFRAERPVLIRLNLDAGAVRPRSYCVLNPFRDRGPEHAAEAVLDSLRQGRREAISGLVDADLRGHILKREEQYRITSWRLCWRTDDPAGAALGYWVRRAGY